jgi:uracil-DNA glycosylase family 4
MNNRMHKQTLLDQLYEPYKNCMRCPLAFQGRNTIIFGEGNANAVLMFIGEAPGNNEDLQGKPFVGRSGKFLTKTFEKIGLHRDLVFITNIVKCHPLNNRKPSIIESKTCKELLLLQQIEIIDPRIICTLGSTATDCFFKNKVQISHIRGTKITFKNSIIIPTYHPAYVLRNQKVADIFFNDIQMAYFESLK